MSELRAFRYSSVHSSMSAIRGSLGDCGARRLDVEQSVRRTVTAPRRAAPSRRRSPYGMPTLPALTISRRSNSRTNGMCVWPQTIVATSAGTSAKHLRPLLQPRVDEHHLVVVARRAVAEQHRAEAVDIERDGVRQPGEQFDVRRRQLVGGVTRDREMRLAHGSGRGRGRPVRARSCPAPARPGRRGWSAGRAPRQAAGRRRCRR